MLSFRVLPLLSVSQFSNLKNCYRDRNQFTAEFSYYHSRRYVFYCFSILSNYNLFQSILCHCMHSSLADYGCKYKIKVDFYRMSFRKPFINCLILHHFKVREAQRGWVISPKVPTKFVRLNMELKSRPLTSKLCNKSCSLYRGLK